MSRKAGYTYPLVGLEQGSEAWGDVLRTEVQVRPMAYGRVRLEVQFNSAEAALYSARRQAEALARGSKDISS